MRVFFKNWYQELISIFRYSQLQHLLFLKKLIGRDSNGVGWAPAEQNAIKRFESEDQVDTDRHQIT